MDPFVSLPGGTRGRESIINCATPLRGWRALHKRQATAKTKRWAILLGKSWVVLPNFSAILSKISEMPDMPVVTSSSAARGAGWGCSLTRPEVQQHSLFSNPNKARCLQPSFLYKPSRSRGTGYWWDCCSCSTLPDHGLSVYQGITTHAWAVDQSNHAHPQ